MSPLLNILDMATRNLIDSKRAIEILNRRATLTVAQAGQQVLLSVQGKGTFMPAADSKVEKQFDEYLYNTRANDSLAISRKENKALFTSAMKAETAGNVEEADKLFNKWLNAVQVTFNQGVERGHRFSDGDAITAVVAEYTSKAGNRSLVLKNVRYKAPVAVEAIKHDLSALMLDDESEEAQEAPIAQPTAVAAQNATVAQG